MADLTAGGWWASLHQLLWAIPLSFDNLWGVQERLNMMLRGEFGALLTALRKYTDKLRPLQKRGKENPRQREVRATEMAEGGGAHGVARGAKILLQEPGVLVTPEVRNQICAKIEVENQEELRTAMAAAKTARTVAGDVAVAMEGTEDKLMSQIMAAITQQDSTVAPGPSGCRAYHLRETMYSKVGRERVLPLLARLMLRCFNEPEKLPSRYWRLFMVSVFQAIGKPDGGTRPLAMTEELRRIFEIVFCQQNGTTMATLLKRVRQMGIAVPAGLEEAVATASLAFDAGWFQWFIDIENAFNAVYRRSIVGGLQQHWPSLIPFFDAAYCVKPPDLLLRLASGEIEVVPSLRGSQQGDQFGGFFFAIASIGELLDFCKTHAGPTSGCVLSSYADDTDLATQEVGPAEAAAFKALAQKFSKVGLRVNARKSGVLCPRDRIFTQRERELVEGLGINCLEEGAAYLGAPVGSKAFKANYLAKCFDRLSIDELARRVARLEASPVAFHILVGSLNAKTQHLARNVAPDEVAPYLRRHDALCLWVLCKSQHIPTASEES
jgi:hypothetical protein